MGKVARSFALIVLLCMAVPNSSILMVKPSEAAQNSSAPNISIIYPTNNTVFNVTFLPAVSFNLTYQTNDTLSWVGYSIDGGQNVTVIRNATDVGRILESRSYHTLTLYANDTRGNWATPQTVTYFVTVYSDATPEPSSPSATDAWVPLVTVAVIVIGVLVAVIAALLFYRRHRKSIK